MALMEIRWNPTRRELRQFGGLLALLLGVLAFWNRAAGTTVLIVCGSLLLLVALLAWLRPSWLRPVYVTWMCLAFPIGWVVSHLLLAAIFYLLLTPLGWLLSLGGYDPLRRRWDRSLDSYWESRKLSADPRRYFRQF